MGTDINVEVQVRKGEEWHSIPHVSGPFESRDSSSDSTRNAPLLYSRSIPVRTNTLQ